MSLRGFEVMSKKAELPISCRIYMKDSHPTLICSVGVYYALNSRFAQLLYNRRTKVLAVVGSNVQGNKWTKRKVAIFGSQVVFDVLRELLPTADKFNKKYRKYIIHGVYNRKDNAVFFDLARAIEYEEAPFLNSIQIERKNRLEQLEFEKLERELALDDGIDYESYHENGEEDYLK